MPRFAIVIQPCDQFTIVFDMSALASSSGDVPPPKRQPVGRAGYRQVIAMEAPTTGDCGQGALAELLRRKWSWGLISTPFIQEIANAAAADGCDKADVHVLAKLGSGGRHASNIHADLLRKLNPSHTSRPV